MRAPSRGGGSTNAARGSDGMGGLRILFAMLVTLLIAHDVDHVVHEGRLGRLDAGFWGFLPLQLASYAGVLYLLARRHPLAPAAAGAVAVAALLAFAGAHLVPFGLLPYADADPAAVSWALLFAPMAVAAVTLVAALRLQAGRRRRASRPTGAFPVSTADRRG